MARAIRVLRADGDWHAVGFDVTALRPLDVDAADIAARTPKGVTCVGTLEREREGSPPQKVVVVYVKAALVPELPFDAERYAEQHPRFPHESTVDQFFGEAQFEAYRLLGQQLAIKLVDAITIDGLCAEVLEAQGAFGS